MKKVVVTGASKGIGLAIALKFASQAGNRVIICSRSQNDLEAAVHHIHDFYLQAEVKYFACDLGKKEETERLAAFVRQEFGYVDVLVNNAGTFLPGQIHTEAEDTLETLMAVNVYSAYWLTRALLPPMMQRRQGHIFNMCSTASITSYVNGGSYCISKHALLGLTKTLRAEMKEHGIKVTAILPGATYTDSWAASGLAEERFMKASDVADAVFMASELSASAVVEEILMRPQLGDI